jgi:PAS domain S-box-containing protein
VSDEVELLRRTLARERAARKETERLLTEKSQELFERNEQLSALNADLEQLVAERTREVERTQRRWRFALEGTGDGVWELGVQDWSAFFSKGFKELMGYSDEEFPNDYQWWRDRAHPDDLPLIFGIFDQYHAGDISTHRVEYRLRHRDGTYRWMLDRGMVIELNANGVPTRIIGTHTDIDHIKRTERELGETNDRLTTLIANMQTAVLLEDADRHIVLTNASFCRMFGLPATPTQLVGFDCKLAATDTAALFTDPDGFVHRIDELLRERKVCTEELLHMVDGRVLERGFVPIVHNGHYLGHLWKYVDVTARVRAQETLQRQEEKYRRILANMNLGLVEVDNEERIRYVNQSFCTLSGYSADELVGGIASEVLLKQDMSEVMRGKNALREKGISDAYEIQVEDREGRPRWWMISGAPLYDASGVKDGSIGIHLDITERKMLEEELRQAKTEAEAQARAKEQFLAHMSHEIRTPMNAIMSMGRELGRTTLDPAQRRYVGAINTASDNLMVIINDILDSSKIEAGRLDLDIVGFKPASVLQHVERVLGHRAQEKRIDLITELDPKVAPVLLGDPHRLDQVLFNITGNALKFTERGEVRLRFQNAGSADGLQQVLITVQDTGFGMSSAFVERIFEPYTQEHRRSGGTGLGMTISKRLVELMNGTIHIDSTEGVGTTVSVRIPFPVGTEQDLPVSAIGHVDTSALEGAHVLLVEDNEMNRFVVRTILGRHRVQLVEANDGSEAMQLLTKGAFDLVLMDVHMPVMDGLEATRLIRSGSDPDLPIIGLTANALRAELDKCTEAGMNAVLTKPFVEEDLVRCMVALMPAQVARTPSERWCDLSKLQAIARGDAAFVQHMIGLFSQQGPATVAEMRMAFAAEQPHRVGELAHRLKSSIDSLGIARLQGVVRRIEALGKEDACSPELAELLAVLEQGVNEAVRELNEGA